MRCARPAPPRTTRARIRSGSSLSPPVTPAAAPLVVERASRSTGRLDPAALAGAPGLCPGALFLVQQSARNHLRQGSGGPPSLSRRRKGRLTTFLPDVCGSRIIALCFAAEVSGHLRIGRLIP